MNTTEQIKRETIAAAVLLLGESDNWPPGPHIEIARDLGYEILAWRRDAGDRPIEPLFNAIRTVADPFQSVLRRLHVLHFRMLLEHGVETGRFERGLDPEVYMLPQK